MTPVHSKCCATPCQPLAACLSIDLAVSTGNAIILQKGLFSTTCPCILMSKAIRTIRHPASQLRAPPILEVTSHRVASPSSTIAPQLRTGSSIALSRRKQIAVTHLKSSVATTSAFTCLVTLGESCSHHLANTSIRTSNRIAAGMQVVRIFASLRRPVNYGMSGRHMELMVTV